MASCFILLSPYLMERHNTGGMEKPSSGPVLMSPGYEKPVTANRIICEFFECLVECQGKDRSFRII